MVPSQKASMSWIDMPADAAASVAASVSRSSTPLSHSSPKRVQPMPMMATWSRMPLLAIALLSSPCVALSCVALSSVALSCAVLSYVGLSSVAVAGTRRPEERAGLPEVIVHALRRPDPPEGHGHPVADRNLRRPGVGQLAAVAPAAVEVDDHPDHRGRQTEGEMVDGERRHRARHVGQPLRLHLVDGVAIEARPGRRHVAEPTGGAAARREGVLPLLGAVHGGSARALGVGP